MEQAVIECRGGKFAYVWSGAVIRSVPGTNYLRHFRGFMAADSEDEAYGIAMKAAMKTYPVNDGWQAHHLDVQRIDDLVWVKRLDMDTVEAVKVP